MKDDKNNVVPIGKEKRAAIVPSLSNSETSKKADRALEEMCEKHGLDPEVYKNPDKLNEHVEKKRSNAAKPESEKATAQIQMRCHPTDKTLIVRNLKRGETLASFMLGLAVEEATRRQNKSD